MIRREIILRVGDTSSSLKRRLARARKRVKKESLTLERTRARKNYWIAVEKTCEARLDLIAQGQVEMKF